MSDNYDANNEINKIINETYVSKGRDYLVPGEKEQERLREQHPMNNALERPIDWGVLNKIQFYSQLSCLVGKDLDDGLFRLKEPYRNLMEAEYAEEMARVKAEYAYEIHWQRMQECHDDGYGEQENRVFDGANRGGEGGNV